MITQALTLETVKSRLDNSSAAIFDNDGTLVDSMPLHYIAWQQSLDLHGMVFPEYQYYSMAGMPASEIIPLLASEQGVEDFDLQAIISSRQKFLEGQLKKVRPIQVVVELLNQAKQRGIPVAIASGGERADVLASLKYADIDVNQFAAIVTAEDVNRGKPHPETFLTAAEKLGVHPSKCIGFEDGEKGLQALASAAMESVDVRRIHGYPLPDCLRAAPTRK